MIKTTKFTIALAIVTMIAAFTINTIAQPRVGGFKPVAKTDPAVQEAAKFAPDAKNKTSPWGYRLVDILKAERQIVAGTNFRMCLSISEAGGQPFAVQAVVYVDLQRVSKLTGWTKTKCAPIPAAADVPAIRVGGYREIAITDKGALLAAEAAIKAQSDKTKKTFELIELTKADSQLVQGSNYKLCMLVGEGGETFFVRVLVYMDLKRTYKLSWWEDSDCGEPEGE